MWGLTTVCLVPILIHAYLGFEHIMGLPKNYSIEPPVAALAALRIYTEHIARSDEVCRWAYPQLTPWQQDLHNVSSNHPGTMTHTPQSCQLYMQRHHLLTDLGCAKGILQSTHNLSSSCPSNAADVFIIFHPGHDQQINGFQYNVAICRFKYLSMPLLDNAASEVLFLRSTPYIVVLFAVAVAIQAIRDRSSCYVSARDVLPSIRSCVLQASQQIRSACSKIVAKLKHQVDNDLEVRREASRLRCEYAERVLGKATVPLIAILALTVWRIHEHYDLCGMICEEARKEVVGSQLLPLIWVCAAFIGVRQARFSTISLDCANVFLSGMWIWRFGTLEARWYERLSSLCWAGRIIQGIVFGNPRLTGALHIVVTLADIMAHTAHTNQARTNVMTTYHLTKKWHDGENLGYALGQAQIVFLITTLSWSFASIMYSEAKALLEAKRADHSCILVHRLLSSMCDCVVHLDLDLSIAKPCPKLANLLFRQSASTMVAQPFVLYIPLAEQDRFTRHVEAERALQVVATGEPGTNVPCHPLHLNLLDAGGMLVHVELFISVIRDANGNEFYLMGIKEDAETQWRGGEAVSETDPPLPQNGLQQERSIDEHSCSHSSGHPSATIISDDVCRELGFPDDAAIVWISTCSPFDLAIIRCNAVFNTLGGSLSIGRPFREWLVDTSDKRAFVGEVQELINLSLERFQTESAETQQDRCVGKITLRPPGMAQGGRYLEITASCKLTCYKNAVLADMNDHEDAIGGSAFESMQLTLTHIRQGYKKKKNKTHRSLMNSQARRAVGQRDTNIMCL